VYNIFVWQAKCHALVALQFCRPPIAFGIILPIGLADLLPMESFRADWHFPAK
jgi:hypothetical protein